MKLEDVARAVGVSKATASRALSGASGVSESTRQRVREMADRLGFRASLAARRLATGQAHTVGVITPSIDRWYFGSVLHGIASACDEADYDVLLYDVGVSASGGRDRFERFLRRGEIDGLVTITWTLGLAESARLTELGVPVATVGEPTPHTRSFSLDDDAAGELGVDHLVSLGHRDILHLVSATDVRPFKASSSDLRRDAYLRAMARHGLEPRPTPTVSGLETARQAALEILARPDRPRAVVASTDDIAIGVLLAARELGMEVPRELSVTGVDDVGLARSFGLTTVRQQPDLHGADAVRWILQRRGSQAAEPDLAHTTYPPELVVRGTTAPPA